MTRKIAIRLRGLRPSRKTLTDRAIDRDFKPPAFLRTPPRGDMAGAAAAGSALGGAGTLGYAHGTGLLDRIDTPDYEARNQLEQARQRERSLYEAAGEGFGNMQETSSELIESMMPALQEIERLKASGASEEEIRDAIMGMLARKPGQQKLNACKGDYHAAIKRVQRRRGDDKYNNVTYNTDAGKPDATHEGKEPHGKDAEDHLFAASTRAFESLQRQRGRKLAEAFLDRAVDLVGS